MAITRDKVFKAGSHTLELSRDVSSLRCRRNIPSRYRPPEPSIIVGEIK